MNVEAPLFSAPSLAVRAQNDYPVQWNGFCTYQTTVRAESPELGLLYAHSDFVAPDQ